MKQQLIHIMPRSGSTMVRQILTELVPEQYIATHKFVEGADSLIITVRDFRDTFISLWRIWNGKFYLGELVNSPGLDEIYMMLLKTHMQINGLNKYLEAYKGKKIIVWKYEDYYNNPDYLIDQIEKVFEIKVSKEKRIEVIKNSSIEINRKRQSEIKIIDKQRIFNNVDRESNIHANHICEVEPAQGYWKQMVSPRFYDIIENNLDTELRKWEYK